MNVLHNFRATLSRGKGLLCLLLGAAMLLTVGFISVKRITISVDGRRHEITTTGNRVDRILHDAGIHLDDKDEFHLSTPKLEDKTEIKIHRAVLVSLFVNGQEHQIKTGKQTVGDLMRDLGYPPGAYHPAPTVDTPVTKGMTIHLKTPAELLEEQARSEVAARREPRHKSIDTSQGMIPYEYVLEMEASAYLPSDGDGNGITASGLPATHGVVAVDPDVIPLGTKVYIPGYGVAIAADTGGMIEGYMIDLCMEDYWSAIQFGRRDIDVYILPEQS